VRDITARRRKISDDSSSSPSKRRDTSNGRLSTTPEEEKLIQDETSETGRVKWAIFVHYLRAIGWGMTFITFLAYFAYQGSSAPSSSHPFVDTKLIFS